jgi:hypothetical protein
MPVELAERFSVSQQSGNPSRWDPLAGIASGSFFFIDNKYQKYQDIISVLFVLIDSF